MKPGTRPAWVFLIAVFHAGLLIVFSHTSQLSPDWLSSVFVYAFVFLPASILHLAITFPVERMHKANHDAVVVTVYFCSLIFFIFIKGYAVHFAEVDPALQRILEAYLALCFTVFMASILMAYFKPPDVFTRARAQIILFGTAAACIPPITNILLVRFMNLHLIPNPALNLVFYTLFPMAIAYAIARHNLFDADIYIKRAVGYAIMTVLVIIGYLTLGTASQTYLLPLLGDQATQSYPLIFALLVILLFNPVYRHVQNLVDRLFFRKSFDYKATVLSVSNALASVLNLQEITHRIVNTVRQQMFIDTVGLLVMNEDKKSYRSFFLRDDQPPLPQGDSDNTQYQLSDPLIGLIASEKRFITRYDLEENPSYRDLKKTGLDQFERLGASIGFPLLHHDALIGVLFIGYKKSGKFYSREDVDLLQTLTTQGAIAIENARLAEQMKHEAMVRTSLTRYLSPQIVEQVMERKMALDLGGQRKTVTVLFSDIRNFTGISETWPPDQLMTILNQYFTDMVRTLFEHQGIIDKFVGDAIVAVFGSLIEVENPAQSAVQAAMAMMHKMPALNQRWEAEYGLTLKMGIGIATGEVFLGNIGSPERMEFTVIGDTVNVASRFSGLAKADQILAAQETIQQLDPGIEFRALPRVKVKGKARNLSVFEIEYGSALG